MDKIQFKVKFFGTKERKGQIKQQATVVMAESEAKVEGRSSVTRLGDHSRSKDTKGSVELWFQKSG